MGVSQALSYWLLQSEVWIILGIVLVILDIFVGFGMILLPVGVAALLLGALLHGHALQFFGDAELFSSWRAVLIWFACLSIVSVGLIKLLIRRFRKNERDINKY